MFARIIHLADMIDIIGNSKDFNGQRWNFICQYLSKNKDRLFDSECVNAFLHAFTKESFMCLSDDSFETNLWGIIPRKKQVFDWETCKNVADFFANIIDYKSYIVVVKEGFRNRIKSRFLRQYQTMLI